MTSKPLDAIALSNLPYKAARRLKMSHRLSFMVQGWIRAEQLTAKGGGTACLTIGCPDEFYAVRLGFPNITSAPWRLRRVIGCASSSFGNYIQPVGTSPWTTFTQALAVNGDEVTFPLADSPSEITVAALEEFAGPKLAPSFTWTDWAPIRSLTADPLSGLRVLMLRGLIPSDQVICYAAGQLRDLLENKAENGGFECFVGGLKFDIDRVTVPDGPEQTATWIGNHLVGGSIFPMVQFLTKNFGQTGLLIGDSHQQGTSTTGQVANFLYRAVVGALQDNLGSRPLGFVNAAQGGLNSAQSFARMHALIDAVRPSYVVLPGWTYNDDDGQEQANQATIERFFARLLGASEACTNRGLVPIFTTPFPRDAARMGKAQLGPWRWLRKEILDMRKTGGYVLDTSQLLSEVNDDGLSGTYQTTFSTDASHPNNAGHSAIAALLHDFLA